MLRSKGIFQYDSTSQEITQLFTAQALINPTIMALLEQRDQGFDAIDITEEPDGREK